MLTPYKVLDKRSHTKQDNEEDHAERFSLHTEVQKHVS